MPLKQNQLLPAELASQTADFARRTWQWTIPAKWKWDDLLNPEVYKHVGEHLKPGDCITVIGQLGDYDCDLRVVAADRGYCLVRPIRTWFTNAVETADNEPSPARAFNSYLGKRLRRDGRGKRARQRAFRQKTRPRQRLRPISQQNRCPPMSRKHLMIFPGTGVDFLRAERSYDGVWLRSSQSTWLPHLLPAVYQSVEMADFSFSSFRELPMGDPSLMPLPPNSPPYQLIILAPVGEPYPTQWGGVFVP